MAEERIERRLAAILAADVVGYSRLMGADEAGTRARFNDQLDQVVRPALDEHRGRLANTMGDGFLVEFGSVVDAVQGALDIQNGTAMRNRDQPEDRKLLLRIGIHLGDVMVEGDDIHGDGVNIAARLEGLAEPGGICVSDMVHAGVRNKLSIRFGDLGEQSLKNIADPLQVFRVILESGDAAGAPASDASFRRPAVAVLPFENMSGDPEQEYFADGLTEDIITALSLWRSFPVIARNSTFAYKGTSPDIRKVGEELGARFVVEGSVRKAGNRVRITAQLINAETGHHVWAERYDRELEDIFDLQDEITHRIAAIIEPAIEQTERQRIVSKPPSDMAAWEYWLRGYAYIYDATAAGNQKAREMFKHAIELDPQYARAHTGLAYTYLKEVRFLGSDDQEETLKLLFESARRAVSLDVTDSEARSMLARACLSAKDFDAAVAEARRAVELNPHHAFSNNVLCAILAFTGHFEESIAWGERALQLNPADPQNFLFLTHLALARLGAENYEESAELARDAIRQRPDFDEPHILLASALGYLDRADEAGSAIGPFRDAAWKFVEERLYWADVTKDCVRDGLRKADLLE